jgi:hypothetical protein
VDREERSSPLNRVLLVFVAAALIANGDGEPTEGGSYFDRRAVPVLPLIEEPLELEGSLGGAAGVHIPGSAVSLNPSGLGSLGVAGRGGVRFPSTSYKRRQCRKHQ